VVGERKVIKSHGNTLKKGGRGLKGYNNTSILKVVTTNKKIKPLVMRLLKSPIMKHGMNGEHKVKTKKPV